MRFRPQGMRFRQKALTFVMAGGRGQRLSPLTNQRSKPAAPFGGRFRIIDFVLSNMVNSGFLSIYVLTQYMSQSLNEHLNDVWNMGAVMDDIFVTSVPAQQRSGEHWYKGTADAVYQNCNLIRDHAPDHLIVFGGDHIFLMDVGQMYDYCIKKDADVGIACIPVPVQDAYRFGVIEIDEDWRITGFREKPTENIPTIPGRPDYVMASMGNYIFKTDSLLDVLEEDAANKDSSHDFGNDVLPKMLAEGKRMYAYDFHQCHIPGNSGDSSYWRDVGTLDAYYDANMDLRAISPELDLYNPEWQIRGERTNLPPVKFVHNVDDRIGQARQSIIAEGTIISGATVTNSVIGRFCRFNSYADIDSCVVMEDVEVGRNTKIRNAIIDKHVVIPEGDVIGYDHETDRKRFKVTENGIVVIAKGTKVQLWEDETP